MYPQVEETIVFHDAFSAIMNQLDSARQALATMNVEHLSLEDKRGSLQAEVASLRRKKQFLVDEISALEEEKERLKDINDEVEDSQETALMKDAEEESWASAMEDYEANNENEKESKAKEDIKDKEAENLKEAGDEDKVNGEVVDIDEVNGLKEVAEVVDEEEVDGPKEVADEEEGEPKLTSDQDKDEGKEGETQEKEVVEKEHEMELDQAETLGVEVEQEDTTEDATEAPTLLAEPEPMDTQDKDSQPATEAGVDIQDSKQTPAEDSQPKKDSSGEEDEVAKDNQDEEDEVTNDNQDEKIEGSEVKDQDDGAKENAVKECTEAVVLGGGSTAMPMDMDTEETTFDSQPSAAPAAREDEADQQANKEDVVAVDKTTAAKVPEENKEQPVIVDRAEASKEDVVVDGDAAAAADPMEESMDVDSQPVDAVKEGSQEVKRPEDSQVSAMMEDNDTLNTLGSGGEEKQTKETKDQEEDEEDEEVGEEKTTGPAIYASQQKMTQSSSDECQEVDDSQASAMMDSQETQGIDSQETQGMETQDMFLFTQHKRKENLSKDTQDRTESSEKEADTAQDNEPTSTSEEPQAMDTQEDSHPTNEPRGYEENEHEEEYEENEYEERDEASMMLDSQETQGFFPLTQKDSQQTQDLFPLSQEENAVEDAAEKEDEILLLETQPTTVTTPRFSFESVHRSGSKKRRASKAFKSPKSWKRMVYNNRLKSTFLASN